MSNKPNNSSGDGPILFFIIFLVASTFIAGGIGTKYNDQALGCIWFGILLMVDTAIVGLVYYLS